MAVTSRPLPTTPAPAATRRRAWIASLATAGVYGLLILALAVLVQRGVGWGQQRLDDLRYGFPRTAQISGVLGHNDSAAAPTHIISINLEGQISILVFPGGDINRLTTLAGPYVVGEDGRYAAPLPTLQDINGDGTPDLLVSVRGETIVYLNRDGTFQLMTPEERATLVEGRHGP